MDIEWVYEYYSQVLEFIQFDFFQVRIDFVLLIWALQLQLMNIPLISCYYVENKQNNFKIETFVN